mmetsp:Transcript_5246/g.6747  ORF Transcript_5246/g.6747 Transcript_5246/m.6747 type:complete len:213 (+) Transcript_5246:84-722(+)
MMMKATLMMSFLTRSMVSFTMPLLISSFHMNINTSIMSATQSLSTSSTLTTSSTLYSKTNNNNNDNNSIDVSDLGITMADLEKPLHPELFSSIESSGYQSTSRIPTTNDSGCYWVEDITDDTIDVTLSIPGLRGQPPQCLAVLFSTTTISVTAFGRVVWSCIQKGISVPDECSFYVDDGKDMIPVIQLSIQKKEEEKRWNGFILQVGEDSIL